MSKEWFIKEGGQVCFKSDNAELDGWDIQSLLDCLNGKEIKIADLEAKLAESEKDRDVWKSMAKCGDKLTEKMRDEYQQLKQQLAEKEKESLKYFKEYRAWKEKCELLEQDQNQTAIAELEKVKELININGYGDNQGNVSWSSIEEIIDQQIAELKGEK